MNAKPEMFKNVICGRALWPAMPFQSLSQFHIQTTNENKHLVSSVSVSVSVSNRWWRHPRHHWIFARKSINYVCIAISFIFSSRFMFASSDCHYNPNQLCLLSIWSIDGSAACRHFKQSKRQCQIDGTTFSIAKWSHLSH